MRKTIFSIALLTFGCATKPHYKPIAISPPTQGPHIVSTRQELEIYWSQARKQTPDNWGDLFETSVISPHQAAYDNLVFQGNYRLKHYPTRLNNFLKKLPNNYEPLVAKFIQFENSVPEQVARFKKTFPEARLNTLVYLMTSLRFDGKTSEIDGIPVIAFGIEYYLNDQTNPDVVFSHELTHLYQMELHQTSSVQTLADKAWQEGIATYASRVLNSDVKDESLIFMDQALANQCRHRSKELLRMFNAANGPIDDKTEEIWFSGQQSLPEIPARAGYCVGYRIAQHLGKTNSLKAMVEWPPDVARPKVLLALKHLSRSF